MRISTKKGDRGKTSLFSGEECNKDNIRVEAYGTVDELGAFLSAAKHAVKNEEVKNIIKEICNDLFKVAGQLATIGDFKHPISSEDVERISNYVHKFEEKIELKGFVIPGNTLQSAKLDVCRTVCRRAERRISALDKKSSVDSELLKYINRLSDLIYILARFEEKKEGKLEFQAWD